MSIGDVALDVMDSLRACLCARFTDDATPCYCGLQPGSLAVADWCTCDGRGGCGMGWVRLDRSFPYATFPQVDQTGGNCGRPMAAVIEVGVFRCAPSQGNRGEPPGADALANAVQQQMDDLGAIHGAITCCDAVTDRFHVIGAYTPRDGGACTGGLMTVTVALSR